MTKRLSNLESDRLAVTAGEPAGIGPELCLSIAESPWSDRAVIIGDPDMIAERAATIDQPTNIREYDPERPAKQGELQVLPVGSLGVVSDGVGRAVTADVTNVVATM